jgi:23S rRNA (guanosine2251-2'-O)-methyltransferase
VAEQTIVGIHAVRAVLQRHPERVSRLWLDSGRQDRRLGEISELAASLGIPLQRIARADMDRRVGQGLRHQGVVATIVAGPELSDAGLPALLQSLPADALVLVLDGVQDPQNLGACLRTAEAAGVSAVVFPKDRAAPVNATARKAASGAAETLPWIRVTNLARALDQLKEQGFWIVGATGDANSDLYQCAFSERSAIVLGAEGSGLRRLTRDRCDTLISIPMAGAVESLNVAAAAAVILFEAMRQRRNA